MRFNHPKVSAIPVRVLRTREPDADNTQFQCGLIVQRTARSFRTPGRACLHDATSVSLKASRMTIVEASVIPMVLVQGGFVAGSGS